MIINDTQDKLLIPFEAFGLFFAETANAELRTLLSDADSADNHIELVELDITPDQLFITLSFTVTGGKALGAFMWLAHSDAMKGINLSHRFDGVGSPNMMTEDYRLNFSHPVF